MFCGFLLIDKPKGITSFYVVRTLRKVLMVKRIGYAGTLDPLASGLMIVAVGEATKLLNFLEQYDKVYDAIVRFGATSETGDAEGPIHPVIDATECTHDQVSQVCTSFLGEGLQVPPKYSAVKIRGRHAYDLARKGKEVVMQPKKVVFHHITLNHFDYPELRCEVHCSTGTYIRSFAHDLGQRLGCSGYLLELRRTRIGNYLLDNAVPLNHLNASNIEQFLQSPHLFLSDWQKCELNDAEYDFLQHGGFVNNRWGLRPGGVLALFGGQTVGMIELCEEGKMVKFAKKFNLT